VSGPARHTHYDTLKVAPTATAEEVRAAYRKAARDAHPDRHGEASSARMAALNEAWRVVGDEARRRRYDHELAATGAASDTASGAASAAAGATGMQRDPAAPPLVVSTGDLSRFPWKFFVVLFVIGVALVLFGAAISDPAPPAEPDDLLLQNECVLIDPSNQELTEVSCIEPHDGIVREVVNFDDTCATGLERLREPRGRGWACIERTAG
jgi:hypothetical protein